MADFYLDHVLIAVRDLEQAAETFSDRLGLTLTPEGVHPCRGTHNRLVVFGPEYLELIAVREPAEPVFRPSMASFLESREGLYMFTLGTNDLDTAVSDLRGRGFQVGEPEPGSRQREDGTIAYTWSSTGVDPTATPGSEVFLIQHDQTVADRYTEPSEPFRHANGATGVHHMALAVHDAEAAASLWQRAFDLSLSQATDILGHEARRVRLKLANCHLDLVSPLRPGALSTFLDRNGEAPYALALTITDVTATMAELRRLGTAVDDAGSDTVAVAHKDAHGVPITFVQS